MRKTEINKHIYFREAIITLLRKELKSHKLTVGILGEAELEFKQTREDFNKLVSEIAKEYDVAMQLVKPYINGCIRFMYEDYKTIKLIWLPDNVDILD